VLYPWLNVLRSAAAAATDLAVGAASDATLAAAVERRAL
jgi:hypothetical protein